MAVQELIYTSILEKRQQISTLQSEIQDLLQQLETQKSKIGIDKWLNHEFESSCSRTPEFTAFTKEYKRELIKQLPKSCEIVNWSVGHFYISCFIKNVKSGKLIYLSISDVRHSKDGWYNNILIRTAQHEKDYTGGSNSYSDFKNLKKNIDYLFTRN